MRIVPLLFALVLLAPASLAFAEDAHGGHGGHGEMTFSSLISNREIQGAIFNFLVLAGIFAWATKKKINPMLAERRRQVVENIEDARRLKEAAEATHKEYAERLAKLDSELGQIRADMVKAGEAERDRIVAEAEKRAASLRTETEFLISQRMKALREELHGEVIDAAIETAAKVLTEKTTADDQTRLANSYLKSVTALGKEKVA